jgi:hypothetical protein
MLRPTWQNETLLSEDCRTPPALKITLRPPWDQVKQKYQMLWVQAEATLGMVAQALLFEGA